MAARASFPEDRSGLADMAFYLFMAQRALSGQAPVRWGDAGWKEDYLAAYRQVISEFSDDYERAEQALRGDEEDEKNYFEQRKARTNKKLSEQLGRRCNEPYHIQILRPHGRSRYGLRLEADAIELTRRATEQAT